MKTKFLLAVAATAGMISATANAAPVALNLLPTAPMIYISGATAPDRTVNAALTSGTIFQLDTIRIFEGETTGTNAGGDDATITCGIPTTASVTSTALTGAFLDSSENTVSISDTTPLCIQKVAHGSQFGSDRVGNETPVGFIDLDEIVDGAGNLIVAGGCTAGVSSGTPGVDEVITHEGCTGTATKVADCGVSDVEPALFQVPASLVTTTAVLDLPWGMQASLPLYYALQAYQYDGQGTCDPKNADYDLELLSGGGANPNYDGLEDTVNSHPDCVPNLTRMQIQSIFTSSLSFADDFRTQTSTLAADSAVTGVAPITGNPYDDTNTDGDGSLTDGDGIVSPIPVADASGRARVYLCRRVETSGTQRSYEAKYLRENCETGIQPMSAGSLNIGGNNDGKDANFLASAGAVVYQNSGSSDVTECLDEATKQNVWAIGINSTEKAVALEDANGAGGSNGTRDGWRHVRVDGVLPTSLNVTTGQYPYFSTVAGNTVPNGDDDKSPDVNGAAEYCLEQIFQGAARATTISSFLDRFEHPWGQGGPLAVTRDLPSLGITNSLPLSSYTDVDGLTEADLAANPVNQFTLAPLGPVNNCQPPVKLPSVVNGGTLDVIPTIVEQL